MVVVYFEELFFVLLGNDVLDVILEVQSSKSTKIWQFRAFWLRKVPRNILALVCLLFGVA